MFGGIRTFLTTMGFVLSLFRSKPLDCRMDKIHHDINRSENSKKLYGKIKRFIVLGYFIVTMLGSITLSFSLYIYQAGRSKAWMNTAVSSTIFTILFCLLLYLMSRICNYRIKTLESNITNQQTNLRQLFSKFMEEGSYKKVLQLRSKYDPEDSLFYDLDFDISGIKPKSILKNRLANGNKTVPSIAATTILNKPSRSLLTNKNMNNSDLSLINSKSPKKDNGSFVVDEDDKLSEDVTGIGHQFQIYRNRSWIDKIIDRLLGDGPENRNALICSNCYAHNGLIPPEDFLGITYRCYNCKTLHHPRKTVSMLQPNTSSSALLARENIIKKIRKKKTVSFESDINENDRSTIEIAETVKISPLMNSTISESNDLNEENQSMSTILCNSAEETIVEKSDDSNPEIENETIELIQSEGLPDGLNES